MYVMINLIDVPLLSRGSCLVIIPYTGINGEAKGIRGIVSSD